MWRRKQFKVRIVYRRESVRQVVERRVAQAELDHTTVIHHDQPVSSDTGTGETGPVFMPGRLSRGFRLLNQGWVFLSEQDVIGKKKRQVWRKAERVEGLSFRDLKPDDFVVHIDHGIGRYQGLQQLTVNGRIRDFLLLSYAENQKLYLPVDRLNLIQRYTGVKGASPPLDRLGGTTFNKRKKRVKESVLKLAAELLKLFSRREVIQGYPFPVDDAWQREFELGFEYEETPDQLRAISEIKQDMERARPMDRIVCGDVGYGKTEVAMRAAFKAAVNGKQVAILVPTTILAQQHFHSFIKRFSAFPLQVAMLSRFLKPRDKTAVRKGLESGSVDVVVGTHGLLADTLKYKDLGLVIIDEEHRFGVKHKERLKQFRARVDVLTMTATPIPRTLNLAMLGLREISMINTPPEARLPIMTKVARFDRSLIRDAILKEMNRGGQIYFVHNRVQSIYALSVMLKTLVPEARFEIAHGQMSESNLEKIMLRFMEQEFDVLISTTIIESGLDIPTVNTIVINRADRLGLAQLYQLRGRVGRDRLQAYAYLLVPASKAMTPTARDRLAAIREAEELGFGFKLATRDMEIRGAGDILGPSQHGQITAVGFEMYCRLIREAVQELKGEQVDDLPDCEIKIPGELVIPDKFIPEPSHRLDIYRRFSSVLEDEDVDGVLAELKDQYGDVPQEIQTLAEMARLRLLARSAHLEVIEFQKGTIKVVFRDSTPIKPEKIMGLLMSQPQRFSFNPPNTLKIKQNEIDSIIPDTQKILRHLLRH